MIYKGYEIADHEYVQNEELLAEFDTNTVSVPLDKLREWINLAKKKFREYRDEHISIPIRAMGIKFHGDGYHNDPDGKDDEPFMNVYLSWYEPESYSEREQRIASEKNRIDNFIAAQASSRQAVRQKKDSELQNAIKIIEEAGGKISNLPNITND